jgi:hypothetical protein
MFSWFIGNVISKKNWLKAIGNDRISAHDQTYNKHAKCNNIVYLVMYINTTDLPWHDVVGSKDVKYWING